MSEFKLTVNDSKEFQFDRKDLLNMDMVQSQSGAFHILQNGKSFNVEIIEANPVSKTFKIKVNRQIHLIEIADQYDQLVKQMGLSATVVHKINEIKAPMPGLVVDVLIHEGEEIQTGDSLIILEAMKMENIIKSPGEGIIKKINVEKGAAVEKNELLIELE